MERRTVLHLIDTGGPGGAETIFLNLVTGLDPARWRSIAAVPEVDWLHGALVAGGIEPVLLPSRGSFDVGYLRRILGLVRTHGVDLVQAHLLTSGVYGSVAGRLARVPVVCTFHGQADVAPDDAYRSAKFRLIDRRSNRVVFVSDSLRRSFLDAVPLAPSRTRVVHNGIDAMSFRPAGDRSVRAELGIGEDEILIGAIGNLRPSKDYPNLLRAAALLHRRSPAYRIVVVGDTRSPIHRELLALREELGLGDVVTFAGFREDIARILGALDIYAISSSAEGFSLSTVQAMACGVPVVATRCGGPEEIVEDGRTGVLVPARSPEALAEAVHDLAGDAARRRRLADAARATVDLRFSLDAMVGGYEAIYDEVLAGRGRSRSVGRRREARRG